MMTSGELTHEHPHIATLREFYAAEIRYVAAGGGRSGASFDEMAESLHPDIVLRQGPSVPYPGTWEGISGVEAFFTAFADTWISLDLSQASHYTNGDGVAVRHRMRAISRATGREVDTMASQFLTFEDGLIRDFVVYYLDPLGVGDVCRP